MVRGESMDIENKIREYSDLVYRIAYSMTKTKVDAEDIYQDVFIKFFNNQLISLFLDFHIDFIFLVI